MSNINIHIIPKVKEFTELNEFAIEYGLKWEYNDFFLPELLDDGAEVDKRFDFYKDHCHPGEDTLHGVFFDILFDSREKIVRDLSMARAKQSCEIASVLGCKGVVFHTNYNSWITDEKYCDRWAEYSEKAYRTLLSEFPKLEIYVENMFDGDPYLLRRLLDNIRHNRFHCCLDTSHAELSPTPLDEWFDVLGDRVKHIHINDNNKKDDLHLALGDGKCDIDKALERIKGLPSVSSVLLEMNGIDKIKKSYDKIKEVF